MKGRKEVTAEDEVVKFFLNLEKNHILKILQIK